MQFPHGSTKFKEVTLVEKTRLRSASKINCDVDSACVNGMCELGFREVFLAV
jgi:hypothetical protein